MLILRSDEVAFLSMKRILIICGIIAFLLLTFFKIVLNGAAFSGVLYPPFLTAGEAQRSLTYVCPALIEPKEIDYKGQRIEFGEAWVEKRSKPSWFLVWIPYRKIVKGYELCFTIKTGNELFRKFPSPWFVIGDRGKGVGSIILNPAPLNGVLFWESIGEKDAGEIIPPSLEMSLIDNWKDPRPKNIKVTFGKHP